MLEISVQTGGLQYNDQNADEVFGMMAAAGFEAIDYSVSYPWDSEIWQKSDEELRESVATVKRALDEYAPLADKQLCFIDRYEIVGNGVEVTHYEDGTRVVGNLSETAQVYDGHTLEAGELLIL